jgi:pimeloyl-ACP methyl ester carboxylesterase
VIRLLLHSLLYFPSRAIIETPDRAGLDYRDLGLETDDGERLHGWWIGAQAEPVGHLLLCHGNAGNVGDRVLHAALLTATGFDVLLFDYRGYGRSGGRPSEEGTYRDARAAMTCLLEQPGVDPARVFYFGESLGGAVALDLALERPPASASWAASTTRSSRGPSSPMPTRPCAASKTCKLRSWCSTATATKSCRSRREGPCSRPPQGRSACTSSPVSATTTSSRSLGPSSPG